MAVSSDNTNSVPAPAGVPIADGQGNITGAWYQFLVNLWLRTGSSAGTLSAALDTISNVVGAILYRAPSPVGWQGLNPGASKQLLRMSSANPALPEWDTFDTSFFGAENVNSFLAGPAAGLAAVPSFRSLASADLSALDGQYPGTTDGAAPNAGDIGEVISSSVAPGAAIVLSSGNASDITSIALGIGDWDIWGNIGLTAAVSGVTSAWINNASATDPTAPNNGAYLSLRPQAGGGVVYPVGMMNLLLNAPATLYLSVDATFAGAVSAYGFIGARRRR